MRNLSHRYKLSARSLREVHQRMVEAVRAYEYRSDLQFRGKKVSNELFINAAALLLADLPPAQQEAVLRKYIPHLEALLAQPEVPGAAAEDPGIDFAVQALVQPAAPKPGKKRQG